MDGRHGGSLRDWERWVQLLQNLAWAVGKGAGVELMMSLVLWAVLLSLTALPWLQQGRREEFLGINHLASELIWCLGVREEADVRVRANWNCIWNGGGPQCCLISCVLIPLGHALEC